MNFPCTVRLSLKVYPTTHFPAGPWMIKTFFSVRRLVSNRVQSGHQLSAAYRCARRRLGQSAASGMHAEQHHSHRWGLGAPRPQVRLDVRQACLRPLVSWKICEMCQIINRRKQRANMLVQGFIQKASNRIYWCEAATRRTKVITFTFNGEADL